MAAIVIANMVGTGVFTTLGLQAVDTRSAFALLVGWILGGIIALCGALSYAELAAALPRSGGEYNFLRRIYHPILGLAAGWVSVTVGFSAPVALAAMALGRYAATIFPLNPMLTAVVAIVFVSAFHAVAARVGQHFQVITTALKIILITTFCAAGLLTVAATDISLSPSRIAFQEILSPAFAVSLIYISYSFSGWNAATYVASEVDRPQKNIPRALVHGTVFVTALYVLLNFVFLRTVPITELVGRIEIGALSAEAIFGARGGTLISGMLCVLLLSTISAMALAGPRVIKTMGEDFPGLSALSVRTRYGAPLPAVVLQQSIAIAFVLTDSFEGVLSYAGFTLNLFTMLAVIGVIVLRRTEPALSRPYKVWGYPLTPALFIVLSTITLLFVLKERPFAAFGGLATVVGAIVLGFAHRQRRMPAGR